MKFKIVVAMLLLLLSMHGVALSKKRLPFINDDFTKALGEAKQRNLPLFVEVWAPW